MTKGVIIFGVGVTVGYALALSQNEEVHGAVVAFKQFLADEALKDDIKRKKAADAAAGAPAESEPEPVEAEVVDDETDEQGETP